MNAPITLRAAGVLVLLLVPAAFAEEAKDPPELTTEDHASKTKGAIQVKGDTRDWFEVLQDGKRVKQIPRTLNGTEEVPPGKYEVRVNKTTRTVTVEVGKKTVLQTGSLVVEGKKGSWYAPFEGKERKVSANPPTLNTPIALFAGTYRVEVRVVDKEVQITDGAKVVPGKKTTLKE
jgi:hypothetical protein